MTASTLAAPVRTVPAAAPAPAVPRPAGGTAGGALQRVRAHLARRREWRRSLRDERALQHAVACAPTAGTAREIAALSARR